MTAGDERTGTVTVVGGPPGAGQREVAIGLAAALGEVMVGGADRLPTSHRRVWRAGSGWGCSRIVLDAVDLVAGGDDLRSALARPAPQLTSSKLPFDVVAGLPAASEWQRCSPAMRRRAGRGDPPSGGRTRVIATSPVVEDLRRWVDRYGLSPTPVGDRGSVSSGVCEATPAWRVAVRRLAGRLAATDAGC